MGNAPILVHSQVSPYLILYWLISTPLCPVQKFGLLFEKESKASPSQLFFLTLSFQFCSQSRWLSTKDENKVWDSLWKSGWHYEYLYVLCNADHRIKFMCTICRFFMWEAERCGLLLNTTPWSRHYLV
jgi:hypothetical protein